MSPPLRHPRTDQPAQITPEQEQMLDRSFDALREETEALAAPARLEADLMAAFRKHHLRRAAQQRWRDALGQWFAPGFALAASLGMSAWMVLAPMAQVAAPGNPMTIAPDDPAAGAEAPFIALQSLEQIALEPRPRLVETAVPRMLLASYGVPVSPESAGDSVHAELLVSANGQPLAMRFRP